MMGIIYSCCMQGSLVKQRKHEVHPWAGTPAMPPLLLGSPIPHSSTSQNVRMVRKAEKHLLRMCVWSICCPLFTLWVPYSNSPISGPKFISGPNLISPHTDFFFHFRPPNAAPQIISGVSFHGRKSTSTHSLMCVCGSIIIAARHRRMLLCSNGRSS